MLLKEMANQNIVKYDLKPLKEKDRTYARLLKIYLDKRFEANRTLSKSRQGTPFKFKYLIWKHDTIKTCF